MLSTQMQPSDPRTKADIARENGAKSHGPVTPEGRARASQNAVQHSLSGTRFVCRNPEEQQRLDELNQSYTSLWKPVNVVEEDLVEEMVVAKYQERKCFDLETALLNLQMRSPKFEALRQNYDALDDIDRQALAFMQSADSSKALALLLRYQSDHSRRYHRAIRQLIAIRAKGVFSTQPEKRNEPTAAPKPRTTQAQTTVQPPDRQPQPAAAAQPVIPIDARPKVFTQTA